MRKGIFLFIVVLLVLCFGLNVEAAYPEKNIQIIVPYAAGGGTDLVARGLAASLEKILDNPVAIVNIEGGSGAVGFAEGAKSKPDGYTLTMVCKPIVTLAAMGLTPVTYEDFELIALINNDPTILCVPSNSKYDDAKVLLEEAKDNDKIRFGSSASPSPGIILLEKVVGGKFTVIPYKGMGEVVPALLGNHIEWSTAAGLGEIAAQLEGGGLKPLAVWSENRIKALPDVPTMKELGYDVQVSTWRGFGAPKGTPKEVISILSDAIAEAVKSDEFVDFMDRAYFVIEYQDSETFTKFAASEFENAKLMLEQQ